MKASRLTAIESFAASDLRDLIHLINEKHYYHVDSTSEHERNGEMFITIGFTDVYSNRNFQKLLKERLPNTQFGFVDLDGDKEDIDFVIDNLNHCYSSTPCNHWNFCKIHICDSKFILPNFIRNSYIKIKINELIVFFNNIPNGKEIGKIDENGYVV